MNIQRGVSYKERIPIFIDKEQKQDGTFYCFDGHNYGFISESRLKEFKQFKTDYLPIFRDKKNDTIVNESYDKSDKKSRKHKLKTLKRLHTEFIRDAQILQKETNGLINLFKTGSNVKTAVELAFHFLNEKEISAEDITLLESEWIENASCGAFIFADKYEGEAFKYDLNSAYPSIYSNVHLLLPVKQGEFKKLTKDEFLKKGFVSYGIYRCTIEYNNDDKNNHKIFKLNDKNYYTNIDINYAVKLGFKITLIEDEDFNFLSYDRSRTKTGSECFSEFVKLLYPLRKNVIVKDRVKSLLRCLWGALSQRNIFKKKYKMDVETELFDDCDIVEMVPFNNDSYQITYMKRDKPYETNYARMKPFLLSKGRVKISEYIAPYKQHIKRCHTDSMTSTIELKHIEHSLELGKMKLEKSGYCVITNSMNEEWKEEK